MALDKGRGVKTQTLSLRLDPKIRFSLEFMSKLKGETFTSLIERAIQEAGANVRTESGKSWEDVWDPNDGVRELSLLSEGGYPTTFDDDDLREFCLQHWQFFYTRGKDALGAHLEPYRRYLEVLWPSIDKYRQIWASDKSKDHWSAGNAMRSDLSASGVKPPEWPPKGEAEPGPRSTGLDDLGPLELE